jgi:hypothetical protein
MIFIEPSYAISRDTDRPGRGSAITANIYRHTAMRDGAAGRYCTENIRQASRGSLRIRSDAVDPVECTRAIAMRSPGGKPVQLDVVASMPMRLTPRRYRSNPAASST